MTKLYVGGKECYDISRQEFEDKSIKYMINSGKGYGTQGLNLALQIAKDIIPEDENRYYVRIKNDL